MIRKIRRLFTRDSRILNDANIRICAFASKLSLRLSPIGLNQEQNKGLFKILPVIVLAPLIVFHQTRKF